MKANKPMINGKNEHITRLPTRLDYRIARLIRERKLAHGNDQKQALINKMLDECYEEKYKKLEK